VDIDTLKLDIAIFSDHIENQSPADGENDDRKIAQVEDPLNGRLIVIQVVPALFTYLCDLVLDEVEESNRHEECEEVLHSKNYVCVRCLILLIQVNGRQLD